MSASRPLRHRPRVLGIVGGGQLARMLVQAASRLGVVTRVFADDQASAAAAVAPDVVRGDAASADDLARFATGCDVVTFDHERVCPDLIAMLEAMGHTVRPGSAAMRYSDKAYQRRALDGHVPMPRFAVIDSDRLPDAVAALDTTVVVKSARGGYDGRGVHVVEPGGGPSLARRLAHGTTHEYVLEEHLAVDAEVAVLAVRRANGELVTYPVAQTGQVDGICREVVAPAQVHPAIAGEAERVAAAVAERVGAVGVLAVELFVVGGKVLLNEVAPRPHNSGHHTIDGSATSQFENHVRAVLDLPLGDTAPLARAVAMVNVLGAPDSSDPRDRLAAALQVPSARVHLYGKPPAPGRKLGHVTALGDAADQALARARLAAATLARPTTQFEGARP